MKAVRIHAFGHSDQMKLEELPAPALRSDEALVRIRAAGVNPVDWKIREGRLQTFMRSSFPLTLGQDFAGDIVEAGAELRGFMAGDRVFGFVSGAYAEYATLTSRDLVRMPVTADYVTAASIPTAGLTAYQIIFDILKPSKGLRVLIHGAAGGVGSFAVQLARAKEARVFATASAGDVDYLKGLGAEEVVDYRSDRFENRLRDLDAVVDLVGGETLERSYAVLRPGGLVVSTVGVPDAGETAKRQLTGRSFQMKRDPWQLAHLAALVDLGVVKPKIGQILPLAEAPRAHDLNEQGRSRGKIILQVA